MKEEYKIRLKERNNYRKIKIKAKKRILKDQGNISV